MQRSVLSWSGGKDATGALHFAEDELEIAELLTTVSERTGRSTMHGVRRHLLEAQAAAIDRPITIVELPAAPDNDTYARRMNAVMNDYVDRGFEAVVFGDLALEDVRAFRESRLADVPIDGLWPIWGWETEDFMHAVLDLGIEAIVVAAEAEHFDREFVGRTFDRETLASLPDGVDPAGENGEFHTFVVDGPMFDERLAVTRGDRVTRTVGEETRMHYCDLQLS